MSKNTFYQGTCMNVSLELKFLILSPQVTSKQPRKIVHLLMGHPVVVASTDFWSMPKHKMIKYLLLNM
jgi:hypothetical protein